MKQNITLAVEQRLLRRARTFAARRGASISGMLAAELRRLVEEEEVYDRAKGKALAQLRAPFRLGGVRITDREALHDRQGLR